MHSVFVQLFVQHLGILLFTIKCEVEAAIVM